MTYVSRAFILFLLLATAGTANAASLTLTPQTGSDGVTSGFAVYLETDAAVLNAVEGRITLPSGVSVDGIDTTGSAITLWVDRPYHVLSDETVAFMGGTPGGFATNASLLLFTMRVSTRDPGTYALGPVDAVVYANDGAGTQESVAGESKKVALGSARERGGYAFLSTPSAPLYAEVGNDPSLFDGLFYIALLGGDSGEGIAYYEVKEGWFSSSVRADRYYVLADQSRSSSIRVTAVTIDGHRSSIVLTPPNPWHDYVVYASALLLSSLALWILMRRRRMMKE